MPIGLPLTTPSLLLRRFVPQDAQRAMELNGEASTSRWLPSHVYADLAEANETMAWLISQYESPGDPRRGAYVLAVEERATSRLLGHVGFSPLDGDVEVSYAIAEQSRGRGYGTEALLHACRWAEQTFGLHRIVAVTSPANDSSCRILLSCGFTHAGDEPMRFQGTHQVVSRYVRETG